MFGDFYMRIRITRKEGGKEGNLVKTLAAIKMGSLTDADEEKRGRVGLVDLPAAELEAEDVRIRVAYCSICGSDPHIAEGVFGAFDQPKGLGHELSGVIAELGPKATVNGFKVGDRVSGNFLYYCGSCYYCHNGQQQFCTHAKTRPAPGMATSVVWKEGQCIKLSDGVSLREGCLLEPVSVAVRIADKAAMKAGERVVVSGGGPIGLLTLQVLRMYGSSELTLIEPIAYRRDLALKYGADHVIDPSREDVAERGREITGGLGYDAVLDASGSPGAVEGLLAIAAKGARVVFGAMYPPEYDLPLNMHRELYLKELSITGVYISPYTFPRAAQLLSRLDLSDLTATVFPLDQGVEAFQAHLSGQYPKVLIRCNEDLE